MEDLADFEVLDRALRALYRARFGLFNDYSRIDSHLRHDKLYLDIFSSIKNKFPVQEGEYHYLLQTAQHGKAGKEYAYSY